MFQDNLKKVKVFQECFNEVLFDKIFFTWISSQLPEQKEGLFFPIKEAHAILNEFGLFPIPIGSFGPSAFCKRRYYIAI